jgi:hypothetical protein
LPGGDAVSSSSVSYNPAHTIRSSKSAVSLSWDTHLERRSGGGLLTMIKKLCILSLPHHLWLPALLYRGM